MAYSPEAEKALAMKVVKKASEDYAVALLRMRRFKKDAEKDKKARYLYECAETTAKKLESFFRGPLFGIYCPNLDAEDFIAKIKKNKSKIARRMSSD